MWRKNQRCRKQNHKEHEADLRLARTDLEEGREKTAQRRIKKSHLTKHCIEECGLTPDWEGVKIDGREDKWMSRRLKETMHTAKRQFEGKDTINDIDVVLHQMWNYTLQNFWKQRRMNVILGKIIS
jgi:hypothetical protein